MSLVKKLMGRRQFLIATGIASTCALTCKKLAGFEVRSAAAAETTASALGMPTGNRCPHLLAPLRIRNRVLKNRILHTVSPTYFMQGPENYPTQMFRNHYSNMAKNAAIVTLNTMFESKGVSAYPKESEVTKDGNDQAFNHYSDRTWADSTLTQNYVNEMIDDIHYQGSLILFAGNTGRGGGGPGGGPGGPGGAKGGKNAKGGQGGMPQGGAQGGQGGMPTGGGPGAQQGGGRGGGMPGGGGFPRMPTQTVEEIVEEAKAYEKKGYDVYQLRSTNPEAARKVRAATNLILMGSIRGAGGGMPGPNQKITPPTRQPTAKELKQALEQAKQMEGAVDILWIRLDEHPNGWTQDEGRPKSLAVAEAIKKAGIDIITCPSAGFHDPVANDEFIASGKTDMVGMTTPFFCDAELVRKLKEGRPDDVLPCIACWDCHGISMNNPPWYSTCALNPTWGLPPYQLRGITAPKVSKKVAVIGGGPAGMKAAMVAADRGHKVTLYEKDKVLGGLLKISDNSKPRWYYRRMKAYFIHQVKKAGVDIKLNTTATPAMIKKAKYDTVLVAAGDEVVTRKIRANGSRVFNILEAYKNLDRVKGDVVVIGAGKFGLEFGVGALLEGHKVTVLGFGKHLVEPELRGAHNMSQQEEVYRSSPNFSYALEVKIKDINGGRVTYTDSRGREKSVKADSIILWNGLRPRMDEAQKFFGSADEVLLLGDCTGEGGTIQKSIRSAFFVASQV